VTIWRLDSEEVTASLSLIELDAFAVVMLTLAARARICTGMQ
jgi:hypothetical protein